MYLKFDLMSCSDENLRLRVAEFKIFNTLYKTKKEAIKIAYAHYLGQQKTL